MPCAWPTACDPVVPRTSSRRGMKVANMSKTCAFPCPSTEPTSGLTMVLKTSGSSSSERAARSIRSTASRAFSGVSTNGSRIWRKSRPPNWVSRLCPKVSAVMAVPSEMNRTVRRMALFFPLLPSTTTPGKAKPGRAGAAVCERGERRAAGARRDGGGFGHEDSGVTMSGRESGQGNQRIVSEYIRWLDQLGMDDLEQVGGKNASLGEMIANLASLGVNVPGGFATTAAAYRDFLSETGLDRRIRNRLEDLDVDDVRELAAAGRE